MPISPDILKKLRLDDSSLVHLDLTAQVTDQDVLKLCDALTGNTCLKSLDVSENELTDEVVAKLAAHPGFTSLDVSENHVDALSMKAFGANQTLEKLTINNPIMSENKVIYGDSFLTEFNGNKTIKRLEMEFVKIDFLGLKILSEHPELEDLELRHCVLVDDRKYEYYAFECLTQIPKLSSLIINDHNLYFALNDVRNQKILSNNSKLTTIVFDTGSFSNLGYPDNHPYAKEIQTRNVHQALLPLLILHECLRGNKKRSVNVTFNEGLFYSIAEFFLPPEKKDKKCETTLSLFKEKVEQPQNERWEYQNTFPSLSSSQQGNQLKTFNDATCFKPVR